MKRRLTVTILIILSIVISCYVISAENTLTYGSENIEKVDNSDNLSNTIQPVNNDTEKLTNEIVDKHEEIKRKDGYNSVLLNFTDSKSNENISMDLKLEQVNSALSNSVSYSTITSAENAGIIKYYESNNDNSSYSLLIKNGYKVRFIMNPSNKECLKGWEDYKENYPIELTAITEGNNQLNIFDISLDYSSDIVSTTVEPRIIK